MINTMMRMKKMKPKLKIICEMLREKLKVIKIINQMKNKRRNFSKKKKKV